MRLGVCVDAYELLSTEFKFNHIPSFRIETSTIQAN